MAPDTLTIRDDRTGTSYTLPIVNGAIRAMDLRQIRTGARDFATALFRRGSRRGSAPGLAELSPAAASSTRRKHSATHPPLHRTGQCSAHSSVATRQDHASIADDLR